MFIKRTIYDSIWSFLDTDEVALITGPRQTGKTTLLFRIYSKLKKEGKLCYFFSLEDPLLLSKLGDHPDNLVQLLDYSPESKKIYVFIDEIQYLENPSNFLKFNYDKYKGKIKLIVTGSSAFYIDRKFKDSLAGRKRIFFMNVFSFEEFLSTKKLNIKDLKLTEKKALMNEYLIYGGYPRVVLTEDPEEKKNILHEIAYAYTKRDISDAGIQKDEIFYRLFVLLSDQIGKTVNVNKLANTLNVSKTVINNFIYIMRKSFHINLVNPFFGNLRKELTKMPKIYFNDFGLRNVFLNNFDKIEHRDDKGEILENMIYKKLLETHDEISINYWSTIEKNEVDFVVKNSVAYESKFKISKIIPKNYDKFIKAYPKTTLKYVYYDKDADKENPDYINFFDL